MHPVARKDLARERFRLRDFIFMMRKSQVFATGMQIKAIAQVLHGHYGTFNMPARTPGADRTFPEGLAFFGSLPESEVAGIVFLIFINVHAGANFHAGEIFL